MQLLAVLAIASLLLFWKISSRGLNEWDEARNGANAWEMLRNHDFINLYFSGALDLWNTKPPLLIWLISGSYKLFGGSAFSLRLPSALSTIGFFLVLFLLVRRGKSKELALLTCGVLLGCSAVIGIHTGLTGDFDALLTLLLTASAYFFWLYNYEGRKNAIYFVALLTGLAWYAKGPAAFMLLPGFFMAGCFRNGGLHGLKDLRVWISALIILAFAGSWFAAISIWGKVEAQGSGGGNAIRNMFVYDLWKRFTESNFEGAGSRDWFFFFSAIDVRLNLWNYVFYLSCLIGVYKIWKSSERWNYFKTAENGMLHFMTCLLFFPVVFLSCASSKHDWYLSPVFFAIAYIAAKGILYICNRSRVLKFSFLALFLFAFGRAWFAVDNYASPAAFIPKEYLMNKDTIITVGNLRQDMYLQLLWTQKPIQSKAVSELIPTSKTLLVIDTFIRNEIQDHSMSLDKQAAGYFIVTSNAEDH